MRRWIAGAWTAVIAATILGGCGGGGTVSGGQQVLTDYAMAIKVVDLDTKASLPDAEVYLITSDGRKIPWQRVVASSTDNPNEVSLNLVRSIKPDLREGDFLLRGIPGTLSIRGIWIRRPNGYTAVARHTTLDNIKRTIQLPDEVNTAPGCLIASNKAGVVQQVFGAPQLIDLGMVELVPNRPNSPPLAVDEPCP